MRDKATVSAQGTPIEAGQVETPTEDRRHLENSRPLTWGRTATGDACTDALSHLLGLLEQGEQRTRVRRAADRERLRLTVEALVLDLYVAAKQDPGQFVAYSRRKADYGETGEQRGASLTSVVAVADFLAHSGFAEGRRGSYSRREGPFAGTVIGAGYRSRLRATPLLVDLLEGTFGVTMDSVTSADGIVGRPIRLKAAGGRGQPKRNLRFTATAQTDAMARRVVAANRLRAGSTFTFDGPCPAGLRLRDTPMHRTFNDGRFDQGGRFYGGWWQGLSKADRARIVIDGETTVELDFQGSQPRLCYHLEGLPLPASVDPYAVEGFAPATYRAAIKEAFGQLTNIGAGVNPGRKNKHLFPTAAAYAGFIHSVEASMSAIAPWLRRCRGLELQFIESEIADGVIARLTDRGIPCLPVHDSFIVPSSAATYTAEAMVNAYRECLGRKTVVEGWPVVRGLTAPD